MSPRHSGHASFSTRHRLIAVPPALGSHCNTAPHSTYVSQIHKRCCCASLHFSGIGGQVRGNTSKLRKRSVSSVGAVVAVGLLTTCDNAPNLYKGRPTSFAAKTGSGHIFITFKRAKP